MTLPSEERLLERRLYALTVKARVPGGECTVGPDEYIALLDAALAIRRLEAWLAVTYKREALLFVNNIGQRRCDLETSNELIDGAGPDLLADLRSALDAAEESR